MMGKINRFSKDEDNTLLSMRKAGFTFAAIAKKLGRWTSVCAGRCDTLYNREDRKQELDALRLNRIDDYEQAELFDLDPWFSLMKGRTFGGLNMAHKPFATSFDVGIQEQRRVRLLTK